MIKNKEKWFVYETEFQEMLDERLSQKSERITLEGLTEFFGPDQEPVSEIAKLSGLKANDSDTLLESSGLVVAADSATLLESLEFRDSASQTEYSGQADPINQLAGLAEPESVVVTEVGEHEEDNPDRLYLQPQQFSIDQMLESLTIEFANRLCEERQIICNLQQQLTEKNQLLINLPDLKQQVEEDQFALQQKEAEITVLKSNISALEKDLSWWKKPWWTRLFGLTKD